MPTITRSFPSINGDPFRNLTVTRTSQGFEMQVDTYERSASLVLSPEVARHLIEALQQEMTLPEE